MHGMSLLHDSSCQVCSAILEQNPLACTESSVVCGLFTAVLVRVHGLGLHLFCLCAQPRSLVSTLLRCRHWLRRVAVGTRSKAPFRVSRTLGSRRCHLLVRKIRQRCCACLSGAVFVLCDRALNASSSVCTNGESRRAVLVPEAGETTTSMLLSRAPPGRIVSLPTVSRASNRLIPPLH